MKFRWDKLGGLLGILYCLVGLFLVFLGWNGAASYDRVLGADPVPHLRRDRRARARRASAPALLIAQSHRADRAALQATLEELRERSSARRGAARGGRGGRRGAAARAPTARCWPARARTTAPDCRLIEGQSGPDADDAAARAQEHGPRALPHLHAADALVDGAVSR